MKKSQYRSFKLNPIAAAVAIALAAQYPVNVAQAGAGWGTGVNAANSPVTIQTYYANSPVGPVPALDAITGTMTLDPLTGLPLVSKTGKALRKFVDTLPGIPGITSKSVMRANGLNNLGQSIPLAVAEKWVDGNGVTTNDDYYEIAAVEFSEKMHSDLPPTHVRGYVQLSTVKNPGKHIALSYPNGTPVLDATGAQVYAYDNPHRLGPVVQAKTGTAVRVKFTNYLPVGGELFIPVDTTLTGAGVGPDGVTKYTQNRAEIHLVGGNAPWISAGNPHQWVAPAGEAAAYAASMGKGVSTQNVPDMVDPGNGSVTLFFPNDISSRFMFYQDRTSGLTRLNSYAGLEAGYFITDATEQALVASGAVPADQLPLIIEDKTFVPDNIAQQDAKWDTAHWGKPGDLWFPHVYETNQSQNTADGANPVGRWDYGPWFWPIFTATEPLPSGNYGDASFTPEAYGDTPVINGTAYPTVTVDPKAYRVRILNASSDRFINLGLYKADTTLRAPQLDLNGNPIVRGDNNQQQYFRNTEVKMVTAVADVGGNALVPTYPVDPLLSSRGYDCYCQYPSLTQLQPANQFSGPNRAWPTDGRAGGAPDPNSVGPDFIAIGSDGGFLPNPVDIPSQPVIYEANRRSITVTNIYGHGLLLGPAERADTIVDFSQYAGQTLILYNDAPAPNPGFDQRVDYYTDNPDFTGVGGTYSTKPGYGPNTRTMMQITVRGGPAAPAYDPTALQTALPAAYAASQARPIVPEAAYNNAFGTTDVDTVAHVATGSLAQPNLDFSTAGTVTLTGLSIISSGGVGSGTGQNYDPLNPPVVNFVMPDGSPAVGVSASAIVDPVSHQVTGFMNVSLAGTFTSAPTVTFTNPSGTSGVGAQAVVSSSNSQSIPVRTKAEQELFDAAGRYNSTGGVELPYTNAAIQDTIPLNYIDSPTEIIKDGETQIWKIVDNGLWSNSMQFNYVDVQLLNRVGWDGTVKTPGNNEVGWKDTLKLNPLEDVIVAMRAKRPAIPFGLPKSSRAQDPSKPLGASGSGLGFTAAPGVISPEGVALLTTTTNVTADFDNEFNWGSAILSHSEDDLLRPIVFHPTVDIPSAPTNLGLTSGNLTWTDPTPAAAATTIANSQNEIGFKIQRANYTLVNGNFVLGAYADVANVPANVTRFNDPAMITGNNYSFIVTAYNAAGATASVATDIITAPATPSNLDGIAVQSANGSADQINLTWTDNAKNETGYRVLRNGVVVATLPANTQNYSDASVVFATTYSYQVQAFNATGPSALSNAVSITSAPAVPAGLNAAVNANTGAVTLRWSTVTGATAYLVSINGGTPILVAGGNTAVYRPTAAQVPVGSVYNFTIAAQIVNVNGTVNSVPSAPVTVDLTVATPVAPVLSAAIPVSTGGNGLRDTLSWGAVPNATSYVIQVSINGGAFATLATITSGTTVTYSAVESAGNTYNYQMLARTTKFGVTNVSPLSNVVTVLTPAATSTGITAAAGAVGSKAITVSWTNTSSNLLPGAAAFTVQRRIGNGAFVTITPTVTGTGTSYSFTDTGLTTGATYRYHVMANGTGGSSVYSASTGGVVAP